MSNKNSEVPCGGQGLQVESQMLVELAQALLLFIESSLEAIERWRPELEWGARYLAASAQMKSAGIIPHQTAPWADFDHLSAESFPAIVLEHYSANWDRIEQAFSDEVSLHKISDETRLAFTEALHCHRNGFYRASVLTLLPAIEREFRLAAQIGPSFQAASLKELREKIKDVPYIDINRPIGPAYLFGIFDTHLYESVKTQDDVDRFMKNPIPNRHAAIHGLVSYTSSLNSINAIILAEYLFFIISKVRSRFP